MLNDDEVIYKWRSFPFIEFPFKSILLILFFILVAYFVFTVTESPFWVILALVFLFGSLFPYFIQTEYRFYDDHVVVSYMGFENENKYSKYKCFYADKRGLLLSTFEKPRGLDRFRGQSIRFTKEQIERKEIMKFLETKIEKRY